MYDKINENFLTIFYMCLLYCNANNLYDIFEFQEIVKCLDRKEDNTYDQLENVFQNLNWTDFLGFLKSNKNDTIDSLYRKSSSHSESSTDSEGAVSIYLLPFPFLRLHPVASAWGSGFSQECH